MSHKDYKVEASYGPLYIHAVPHDDDVIPSMLYEDYMLRVSYRRMTTIYMIRCSVRGMVLVSCEDHMIMVLLCKDYEVEVSHGPLNCCYITLLMTLLSSKKYIMKVSHCHIKWSSRHVRTI